MDETTKKNAIVRAMTEIECYPVIQEEIAIQEYTKVPLGQLSAMGATFASVAPALKNIFNGVQNSGVGQQLYSMRIPNGLGLGESLQLAKDGGLAWKCCKFKRKDNAKGTFSRRCKVLPELLLKLTRLLC